MILKTKKILIGITGGIAAYKVAELVRLCKKSQAEVKVIMTRSAQEFITPLTFATLSGNKVHTDLFQQDLDYKIEHIGLARWADIILIAPATANIIAKLANGIADDLLSTVCLATNAPIAVAPAMNYQMWLNPRTQNNINSLEHQGLNIIGPDTGVQACGEIGAGRMLEPTAIFAQLENILSNQNLLHGYKLLITAGPTHESYDSVRYISNYSSGKMGYAIAHAATEAGADVTLISGPTHLNCSSKIRKINVTSAQEMFDAVAMHLQENTCDIFIAAAAVADYHPIQTFTQKQKRHTKEITLHLMRTPDILAHVTSLKKPPFTVGFAAETENIYENAKQKLHAKKVDILIANKVGFDNTEQQMVGFENDNNELFIFGKDTSQYNPTNPLHLSLAPKTLLAKQLVQLISLQLKKQKTYR